MHNGALQELEVKNKLYPRTSTNFQLTPEFIYPLSESSMLSPCTEEYDFTLKKHDKKCLIEDMNANFKPQLNEVSKTYKNVFPVFNRDHNFRSPAFIIPTEQKTGGYWETHWRRRIQNSIPKSVSGNAQILFPEKQGSTFCGVCICRYQDYWQHTNSQGHKRNIKKSKGQKYIKKFVRKLKKASK